MFWACIYMYLNKIVFYSQVQEFLTISHEQITMATFVFEKNVKRRMLHQNENNSYEGKVSGERNFTIYKQKYAFFYGIHE